MVIELLPAQQILLPPEDQALVKGGGAVPRVHRELDGLHLLHRLLGQERLPVVHPVARQNGHQLGQVRRADGQPARVVGGPQADLVRDGLACLLSGAPQHVPPGVIEGGHLLRLQLSRVEGGPDTHGLQEPALKIAVQQLPGGQLQSGAQHADAEVAVIPGLWGPRLHIPPGGGAG